MTSKAESGVETPVRPTGGRERRSTVAARSELSEIELQSRLLVAFPWAKHLPPPERARFAHELTHHPTDIPNNQLEALLVSWKAAARAAEQRTQRLRRAA